VTLNEQMGIEHLVPVLDVPQSAALEEGAQAGRVMAKAQRFRKRPEERRRRGLDFGGNQGGGWPLSPRPKVKSA